MNTNPEGFIRPRRPQTARSSQRPPFSQGAVPYFARRCIRTTLPIRTIVKGTPHPAMQAIKEHTDVTVGLVIPTKGKERRANTSLEEQSDWIRRSISAEELETAQLPTPIRVSSRKLVHKPISWYPRPDNLQPVFEEARWVKKSTGAAWKWLNTPNEDYLSGRRPVDMTGNDEEAAELQAYMRKYAENHDL